MNPLLHTLPILCLLCLSPLHLEAAERVHTVFSLAGMPPVSSPPPGSPLHLTAETQPDGTQRWAVHQHETLLGYVPARHTARMDELAVRAIPLRLRVRHTSHDPRPGDFLTVELLIPDTVPAGLLPDFSPPTGEYGPEFYAFLED